MHVKAKQFGYLGLKILKEQFQEIDLYKRDTFHYYANLSDKPEALKNCIIVTQLIALTQTILASKKNPTISLATHSMFSPQEDPLEALIQKLRASLETPGLIK